MTILLDTNVVLDVLLDREPFSSVAAKLFTFVADGHIRGLLGATTMTTIYYLAQKARDRKTAQHAINNLLQLFQIAPVNASILQSALRLNFEDYEDAVLHEAGKQAGAKIIVTRDAHGFKKATLPVMTPAELLLSLEMG